MPLAPAQRIDAATALQAQRAIAAAADAAPAEEKAKVGAQYERRGGRVVEQLLESVDLIDAAYLIALGGTGGVVPRCQDVPAVARINAANVWRLRCWDASHSLPVLVLSYGWLDRHHPAKHGATLRRLLPILRACLAEARTFGAHATFGVFWDCLSLPQYPRSGAEEARFKQGLAAMTCLFSHPHTTVLCARAPVPLTGDYENMRPYDERGWCHFELRTACIAKHGRCLWDLSLHREGSAIDFVRCQLDLKPATRPPLTSPEQMAKELRDDVTFTMRADVATVTELYAEGFVRAFDTHRKASADAVFYDSLGWGTAEVPTLVAAFAYAEAHCRPKDAEGEKDDRLVLYIVGNKFTERETARLRAAVPKGSKKFLISAQ
jgi:hypothetical protein